MPDTLRAGIGRSFAILAERDYVIVSVLPEASPPKFPVCLVKHRELMPQTRRRSVVDYLTQALKSLVS